MIELKKNKETFTLAWTGASGLVYGIELLRFLLNSNKNVSLIYSPAAQLVARQEMDLILDSDPEKTFDLLCEFYQLNESQKNNFYVYGYQDWFAPSASGSSVADAMIVCPCTMGSVAAIANGLSQNLIERSADVCLKENRPLLIVPRETPFSVIHLENMLKLARRGVRLIPAIPGFYSRPKKIDEVVAFVVGKILDQLGVEHDLFTRWSDIKKEI